MGDKNQLLFAQRHSDRLSGPYLEVGSKDYGDTQDLRSLFAPRGPYVGVDLEEGRGVDAVLDLSRPFEEIDARLGHVRFGTIFCLSVLEHCADPFRMAENLTRLLGPKGAVCLSVPFAWQFHAYPSDYWRFTHEGVRKLFPRLEFRPEDGVWATSQIGDFRPLDADVGMIGFGSKWNRRRGRPWRAVSAALIAVAAKIGVYRWLAGYPYVLAPTSIMMIGRLP